MTRIGHEEGGIFRIVFRSWSTLLCFEMAYRGLGFLVLFPLLRGGLSRLPGLVGAAYLGQDNFSLIFRRPEAILLLLGILLLAGTYLLFELTALFLYAEKGWRRQRVSLWELLHSTAARTASLLRPERLPVLFLLPVMALSVFSLLSGYLRTVRIPEFVMEYVVADRILLACFSAVVVICHLILFSYLFGFPSLLFADRSFAASWRESLDLLRGRKLRTAGTMLGQYLLYTLIMLAMAGAAVLLLYGGVKLSYAEVTVARGQFRLFFQSFQEVGSIVAGALTSAFLCAVIVVLYHLYRTEFRPEQSQEPRSIRRSAARAGAVLATLILLMVFSESEAGGRALYPAGAATQIVAHRAGAAFAPENTVAALNRAVEDGAHMAEIDVQQLGDGTLVVLHDTNFRRTAGVDLDVWDAELPTVRSLDAGWFHHSRSTQSPLTAREPVPTLDDMLTAAKGRIGLMIELKSTGREQNLVAVTLSHIKDHAMEGQCVIASMDMDLLRQVKALNPEMNTVLISVLLLSEDYDLKNIDAYSVETTSLSYGMVVQAHLQGKQVYGWTVNSEETVNRVLRCGVDGLVTDNPPLAQYCISMVGESYLRDKITDLFFPLHKKESGSPDSPAEHGPTAAYIFQTLPSRSTPSIRRPVRP